MILAELKLYVIAMTALKASHVTYSKNGYGRKNLNWNGAEIDELPVIPESKSTLFDGDLEEMTLNTAYTGSFTIDFYGEQSLENATLFSNMQMSQQAYEWQRDNGIAFFHCSAVTNIHILDRGANQERYQVEIKASFNKTTVIDTLRIDEIQTNIITD